ncbi:MAG: sigma 54-interacting transcriptional regulator [Planctomycetota bacterium]
MRSLLSGLEAIGAERSGASYEDVEAIERRDAFAWEFAEEVLSSLKMRRAVFAIDDVEAADPLTISVLSSIVRELSRRAATGEFPCHFLFAYRSEKGLREATDSLSRALRAAGGPNALVPLHALNGDETSEWLRWALDARPERYETLQRELERGALPSTIRGRLRRDTPSSAPSALDEIASAEGYEMSRRVLDVSAAIGRPAPLEFFSVVLDCELASLRSSVDELRSAGVLRESEEVVDLAVEELSDRWCEIRGQHALRAVHGDIARGLTPDTEAFPGEAASHALRSDEASAAIDAAFEAAASLVRRHDDRRALELYGCLEEVLGDDARARTAKRQCADALARTGQQRRAAEAYEALLADAEEGERGDLLSRLGASHHRAGDVALAVSQLERSLLELEDAVDDESFHARLHVWLELAEIHNSRGEYDDAERFCRLAIRSLDENEPVEVSASRRARMVALETLAHASLRRFRYGEAADYFERSLQASEDLGVVAERSLILNNLGILHNQENRFERAIECYEEAERLSARLGGDLILANIYSNLAVLYAKTAEPDEADEALRRAARHDEAGESTRTRCFRHHAAGLVDIYSGRYTSAIEALKVAIALAGEHKDRFLETFDLVYLAECHLYRGEIPAATAALDRVERLEAGDAVLAMVCARRAALAALAGESERAIEIVRSYPEPESAIPFLRAWDAYFLGWAARSVGDTELASKELPSAQRFFARTGVACGEVFAELELVALDGLRSRPVRALRRVRKLKARFRPGRGALRNAALSARLLVYEARALLESKTVDANEINQLLVEAESYLIGRHAQDLESLARSLRRALRERQPAAGLSTYVAVPELAGRRDEELYRSFREAGRELVAKLRGDSTASQTGGAEPAIREFEEQLARLQRQVEGRPDDRSATAKAEHLRGDSEATKRLREWVRRVAARELPVLIVGETGSGKDFVARAIHGESARRERPFVALDCAAVPRELLESELFGISAGAFTGAEENKAGLLASADGGTFFFDEVAEMDLELQAKLLRVLDRGVVRPVGSTEETRVDLRFVFATHRDLSSLAEEGKIRSDFFYRVRGLEIEVPPLRDRIEDLPLLIETFRADCGDPERLPRFESDGLAALSTYPWPGNVRELKNAVQNLVLTSAGSIRADDVERVLGERPEDGLFSPALLRSRPLPQLVEQLEKEYLVRLHADSNADLQVMAKTLGISLQALYARFKARGLKPKELKARFR